MARARSVPHPPCVCAGYMEAGHEEGLTCRSPPWGERPGQAINRRPEPLGGRARGRTEPAARQWHRLCMHACPGACATVRARERAACRSRPASHLTMGAGGAIQCARIEGARRMRPTVVRPTPRGRGTHRLLARTAARYARLCLAR